MPDDVQPADHFADHFAVYRRCRAYWFGPDPSEAAFASCCGDVLDPLPIPDQLAFFGWCVRCLSNWSRVGPERVVSERHCFAAVARQVSLRLECAALSPEEQREYERTGDDFMDAYLTDILPPERWGCWPDDDADPVA